MLSGGLIRNLGPRAVVLLCLIRIDNGNIVHLDPTLGQLTIDAGYVDDHLAELSKDEDLSRYIL